MLSNGIGRLSWGRSATGAMTAEPKEMARATPCCMSKRKHGAAPFWFACTLWMWATAPALSEVIVKTPLGQLQGTTADGVTAFRGIAYAAAPIGALRWKPPQPVKSWTGIKHADRNGPACMQGPLPYVNLGSEPKLSEDCLYLNLWRPAQAGLHSALPVLVWLHGGGFAFGTANSTSSDGARLAKAGVIVVAVNYRLGRFGWFAYPELTKEETAQGTANFGLMDQIAALKWVQENISAFGGDKANVTLFGESAGAMSVNVLMTIPATNGLFAKAITESGLGRWPARPLSVAEKMGSEFAASIHAKNLEALRAMPADSILGSPSAMTAADAPTPVIDGRLVREDVDTAFASGEAKKIPWIVGTNNYEASLFSDRLGNADQLFEKMASSQREILSSLYGDAGNKSKKALVDELVTDAVFTEPARFLAENHARSGAPVYRYMFSYVPEQARTMLPGAPHGGEVEFVFGNLGASGNLRIGYTAQDHAISDLMMRYWVNFARSGDPNGTDAPVWTRDGEDDLLMIDTIKPHVIKNFRKNILDEVTHLSAMINK
jgi:para-nitrobenzyl esterase